MRPTAALVVALAAVTATVAKILLAATSFGTNDVGYWTEFASAVATVGPIEVYGVRGMSYDFTHPPLAGWMLVLVNHLQDLGLRLPLLVRLPASLADALTCWLVFRLLSERVGSARAALVASAVVWSPAPGGDLGVPRQHGSGVRGVDPRLVLCVDRLDRPLIAGLCIAAAISLKLVPVVALPWLLLLAFRAGRARLARFVVGGGLVLVVVWVPVLLTAWPEFREVVLGYQGISVREWGLAELVESTGHPRAELWLATRGSAVVLVASYLPFVVFVARRPHWDQVGLGLTLVSMLLLSPAYGMQYLSWGIAASYLVSPRAGWLFNGAASIFALAVYSSWSGGGPPWEWDRALGPPVLLRRAPADDPDLEHAARGVAGRARAAPTGPGQA